MITQEKLTALLHSLTLDQIRSMLEQADIPAPKARAKKEEVVAHATKRLLTPDTLEKALSAITLRTDQAGILLDLPATRVRKLVQQGVLPASKVRFRYGTAAAIPAIEVIRKEQEIERALAPEKEKIEKDRQKTKIKREETERKRQEIIQCLAQEKEKTERERQETLKRQKEAEEALNRLLSVPQPEETPFTPSPFQTQAITALSKGQDVLVCAPTGSGKTYVAIERARAVLTLGGRVFYASPLKALSNQKLTEFQGLFGKENAGILTGERKENSRAPLIVCTTEILRNIILDEDMRNGLTLIVLDEAHWLADEERGEVWEEIIILAPPEMQLLLLSASIGNPEEISQWCKNARGNPLTVIRENERPVPLHPTIADTALFPLSLYQPAVRKPQHPSYRQLISILEKHNALPALFFMPRRRQCEEVLSLFGPLPDNGPAHRVLAAAQAHGIAAHHAGLPLAVRLEIEEKLRQGELRAVFCTKTLASGLDVSARAVVLTALDNGLGEPLTSTEFQQMSGRAGRRGKDPFGVVCLTIPTKKELPLFTQLISSPPEPLKSSFSPSYSTILNLLRRTNLEGAKYIMRKSLYAFQNQDKIHTLTTKTEEQGKRIRSLLNGFSSKACTDPFTTRQSYNKAIQDKTEQLLTNLPGPLLTRNSQSNPGIILTSLQKGTLFVRYTTKTGLTLSHKSELPHILGVIQDTPLPLFALPTTPTEVHTLEYGEWICGEQAGELALVVKKKARRKKGRKYILGSEETGRWLLPQAQNIRKIDLSEWSSKAQNWLDSPPPLIPIEEFLSRELQDTSPCPTCPAFTRCPDTLKDLTEVHKEQQATEEALATHDPAATLATRARVLKQLGYLNEDWTLTEKGQWAAHIRHPLCLLLAECSPKLATLSPPQLAITAGAFTTEKVGRAFAEHKPVMWVSFYIDRLLKLEAKQGVPHEPEIVNLRDEFQRKTRTLWRRRWNDWEDEEWDEDDYREDWSRTITLPCRAESRAALVQAWVGGAKFSTLAQRGIEPGDLERLLLRTAEILRQLESTGFANLKDTAREALRLVLRPPLPYC